MKEFIFALLLLINIYSVATATCKNTDKVLTDQLISDDKKSITQTLTVDKNSLRFSSDSIAFIATINKNNCEDISLEYSEVNGNTKPDSLSKIPFTVKDKKKVDGKCYYQYVINDKAAAIKEYFKSSEISLTFTPAETNSDNTYSAGTAVTCSVEFHEAPASKVEKNGLSKGAIAGIVIAVVVIIAAVGALIFLLLKKIIVLEEPGNKIDMSEKNLNADKAAESKEREVNVEINNNNGNNNNDGKVQASSNRD